MQQFVLPLANQRLGNDEEDALRPFGPALRDDETGLDGLAEADFVRKDATALAQTPEGENHGVDLVWVWIDSRLTLGRRIALAVVGSADPHEVLGKHPEIEVVERHRSSPPRGRRCHGTHHRRVRVAIKRNLDGSIQVDASVRALLTSHSLIYSQLVI